MSSEPSGSLVLDTGVLLELAFDSARTKPLRDRIVAGETQPITGELNVTELSYLLCRRIGQESADRSVSYLRQAKEFKILPSSSFLDSAARMKCARSISLVDCVTICMAESLDVPVLFASHEEEIEKEMKKKRTPFKPRFFFLGSWPKARTGQSMRDA